MTSWTICDRQAKCISEQTIIQNREYNLASQKPKQSPGFIFWLLLAFALSSQVANANPYDECILKFMGSARDQTAVYDIERACISESSVNLIASQADGISNAVAYAGSFYLGYGFMEPGLVIQFTNMTKFDLTTIDVTLITKKDNVRHDYIVREFDGPVLPHTFVTGVPEPAFDQIIKTGAWAEFFVGVSDLIDNGKNFSKNYSWSLAPIKGIPSS
jgi:hypothetical protein